MGVQVQIPMSVLCDNMSLRCVHTFFDPYSEFAKSYDHDKYMPMHEFNAGIMDIEDCLINEWIMQKVIAENMIKQIEKKMVMYEIALRYVCYGFLININNYITELLMEKESKRKRKQKTSKDLVRIQN